MVRFLLIGISVILISGCETATTQRTESSSAGFTKTAKAEILAQNLSFDAETGEIAYTLPEYAYVRIRLGIKNGGPLVTHILDLEYRSKGAHVERWYGVVEGINGDLRQRKDLMINFLAVSVEKNEEDLSKLSIRKAPKFSISFFEPLEKNTLGLPVIRGLTPIKVILSPEDEHWFSTIRYEIAMFIDQIFLMEEEEGMSPFTYYLNTKNMPDGVHTLTVNVVSYEGDAAALNMLVLVDNTSLTAGEQAKLNE